MEINIFFRKDEDQKGYKRDIKTAAFTNLLKILISCQPKKTEIEVYISISNFLGLESRKHLL